MKVSKVLVPLFLLISITCAFSSAASGVMIFGSWDTTEKASKDAARISGILGQNATTMEATVNGRTVHRVVVPVATEEDRSALAQTAKKNNLQSWFLTTERLPETKAPTALADATVAPSDNDESATVSEEFVLSVSDADPDAVLSYLDQATINSTISKLDAVRQRAQQLIPEFKPRNEEQPPLDGEREAPNVEGVQEQEQAADSSTSEST